MDSRIVISTNGVGGVSFPRALFAQSLVILGIFYAATFYTALYVSHKTDSAESIYRYRERRSFVPLQILVTINVSFDLTRQRY